MNHVAVTAAAAAAVGNVYLGFIKRRVLNYLRGSMLSNDGRGLVDYTWLDSMIDNYRIVKDRFWRRQEA